MRALASLLVVASAALVLPRATAIAAPPPEALCSNPTPIGTLYGQPEMNGVAVGGTLLVFPPTTSTVRGGAPTKFVFQLSGHGSLQLWATGPDGQRITPGDVRVHDPVSTTPGIAEWGSGWTFPTAGCWTVHAARDDVSGYVLMSVTLPQLNSVTVALRDHGVAAPTVRAGHGRLTVRMAVAYPDRSSPQTHITFWSGGRRIGVVGWRLPTGGTVANPTFDVPLGFKLATPATVVAVVRVRLGSQTVTQRVTFRVVRSAA